MPGFNWSKSRAVHLNSHCKRAGIEKYCPSLSRLVSGSVCGCKLARATVSAHVARVAHAGHLNGSRFEGCFSLKRCQIVMNMAINCLACGPFLRATHGGTLRSQFGTSQRRYQDRQPAILQLVDMQDDRTGCPKSAFFGVFKRGCGHPSCGAALHAAVIKQRACGATPKAARD